MTVYRTPDGRDPGRLLADARPSDAGAVVAAIVLTAAVVVGFYSLAVPPKTANHWLTILGVAALALVTGIPLLFAKPVRVRVFEHGISVNRPAERFFEWSAIEELRIRRVVGRGLRIDVVTFHLKDGTKLETTLEDESVVDEIRKRSSEHLLAIARRRIEAGESLRFGEITVDAAGVARGRTRIAWRDVASVGYEGTHKALTVRGSDEEIAEPLESVPNAHVLVALATK